MLPVRPRRGPLSLELGLGVGMLAWALVAVPLGLDRVAEAPVVAAGLELGRGAGDAGAGAPPLVVLLLRLFACLPVGDLAARANLAAVACAAAAAVLLGRLAFRILRGLDAGDATLGPTLTAVAAPGPAEAAVAQADDTAPNVPITEGASAAPPIFEGRSEPWPWPAKRPQLRVVPGAQAQARHAAPAQRGATRAAGRATPSHAVMAQLLAGMAAAPAPIAMMTASPSRSSRAHAGRVAAPGVAPPSAHEIFALVGAIACGLGSLGAFLALTSAPAAALTLALVVGAWLQLLAFDRRPGTPRRGLALALLAGLAAGADPVAALFIWPAVGVICVRLLRQGERWPLLAPAAFVVGAAVTVPWWTSAPPLVGSVRAAWGALGALVGAFTSAEGLRVMLGVGRELIAQWGVVAALTAAVGAVVLLGRRPRWFGFGLVSAVGALALVASEADAGAAGARFVPGSAAWVVLSASIVIPLMLGVIRLAATLGPARGAGALCLAVVAASWPLLDGGSARFHRGPGLPEALLERAQEELEPGARVEPGSLPMSQLFRYGRALGLRPDLEIAPVPATPRPGAPLAVH
jgi:hypothetical protein